MAAARASMPWSPACRRTRRRRLFARPGTRASRASRASCPSISRSPTRSLELAEREAGRLHRRRSRAAVEPGRCRPFRAARAAASSGRPPRRRAWSRARRSRKHSWRGTACRQRDSNVDEPMTALGDRAVRAVRVSGRAQGGWPRRRQGRRHCRRSGEAEAAIARAMNERRFGDAGARARDRGMPERSRGFVFRRSATASRLSDRNGAGSQANFRRRSRAEHRRHGRVRAQPAHRCRASRLG